MSQNFNVAMTAGQYYQLRVWYQNYLGDQALYNYWTKPSSSEELVPGSAFYYRRHVGSTPYQVSVACPTGYSGTEIAYPYKCKEICGDGLRVGSEICDDGNTNDNDGCNSN